MVSSDDGARSVRSITTPTAGRSLRGATPAPDRPDDAGRQRLPRGRDNSPSRLGLPRPESHSKRPGVSRGGTSSVLALVEGPGGWFQIEVFVDPPRRPNLRVIQGGKAD